MQDKNQKTEIVVSVVFLALLLLFINPFHFWMPDALLYMLVAGLLILFALFAGVVWKEKPRDEREVFHVMHAARIGYLLGIAVLVLGVVYESFLSHVDVWLLVALGVMILGKLAALVYNSFHN
jgi:uncharacterized membrane protein